MSAGLVSGVVPAMPIVVNDVLEVVVDWEVVGAVRSTGV